ncbi:MAG: hypothetical protein ACRC2V_00490 [Xenococcaceae cyanobacterium]
MLTNSHEQTMGLDFFFGYWIPRLYPDLKYSDSCLKQKTRTPEGTIEELTWKQACIREIVKWGYQHSYVKNLPIGFKRIPAQIKEKAYFMHIAYQEKYGQQAT